MRAIRLFLLAILGIGILGFGAIYGLSEQHLRDVTLKPAFQHPIKSDSSTLARGRHIAQTRGCFGCHGRQLEGRVFTEWDWVDLAVATNLSQHAKIYDAASLEAAIRQGIGHDGRALWSMPSYNWTFKFNQIRVCITLV